MVAVLCATVIGIISITLSGYAVDDAYITFRHAANLATGRGFAFNGGDRLLSTTSPLHALSLALLATFGGVGNIPQFALWLSAMAMLALCVSVLLIAYNQQIIAVGVVCAILVVSQHWFYRFFSLESVLVLSLNLGAIALVFHRRYGLAGLVAGFAVVGRADSILLAALLGMYVLWLEWKRKPEFIRYILGGTLLTGSWWLFAGVYFGNLFPNTLAAKSGFASPWMFSSYIWPKILSDLFPGYQPVSILLVFMAAIGFAVLLSRRSPLLLLPGWIVLHTIAYTLLRITYPFSWYYTPLIFTALFLGSVGGVTIASYLIKKAVPRGPGVTAVTVGATLVLMAACLTISLRSTWSFASNYGTAYYGGARDAVYRQVAEWLTVNSRPDAVIAMTEVGTVGFFSERRIIDLLGLVTFELRDLPKRGTFLETVLELKPDYVIGVRGLPPDPTLAGIDGYTSVKSFPKGDQNGFEDIIIYARHDIAMTPGSTSDAQK
jgi:arabinofuranosyltransferase